MSKEKIDILFKEIVLLNEEKSKKLREIEDKQFRLDFVDNLFLENKTLLLEANVDGVGIIKAEFDAKKLQDEIKNKHKILRLIATEAKLL